jgi:hypothetical protein
MSRLRQPSGAAAACARQRQDRSCLEAAVAAYGSHDVKRAGLTLLVLVAVAAAGAIGFMAWANSEFTECYALFSSESDAEAVADELRQAAPHLGIDLDNERRGGEVATTFSTGASGEDARPLTRAFRSAVRAHGGKLGHPDEGCLERGPFM